MFEFGPGLEFEESDSTRQNFFLAFQFHDLQSSYGLTLFCATMFVSSSTPSVSSQFFVANNAISPTALAPQLLLPPCPGACGWRPTPALLLSDNLTARTSGDGIATQFADGDRIAALDEEAIIELIFAHCRPCPWGTRRWWHNSAANDVGGGGGGGDSLCRPCETPLRTFDYLFLLFHVIVPFVLNSVAICYYANRMRQTRRLLLWTVCQLVCALLECSLAFIGALLIFRPFGELRTFGCAREGKLEEWYSMWNNPVLHYSRVLHCSSELVYPLYSLPFVIYALNLATLLIVRSLLHIAVAAFCNTSLPSAPFYAALWALPLLALAHAVLSGVLFALFPFIALLAALLHLVVQLSVHATHRTRSPSAAAATSGVLFALFPFIALLAALLHLVVQLSVHATHRTRSPSAAAATVSSPATTVRGMFRLLLSTGLHYQRGRPVPLWLPWLVHLALFAFALLSLLIAFGAPNSGQMAELVATLFGGTRSLLALTLSKRPSNNDFPSPHIEHFWMCLSAAGSVSLITLLLLPTHCGSSGGDVSPYFRHCLATCSILSPSAPLSSACPIKEPTAFAWWAREHCFRCRQSCIWRTVDEFARRTAAATPQFFGKWPFIPLLLHLGPLFVPVQEPASVLFSLLNLCSVLAMQKRIRARVPCTFHCRNEWIQFGWAGAVAWSASAIFHLCDHRVTEALDYGAALGLILFTLYASVSFVAPALLQFCCSIRISSGRVVKVVGAVLSAFYVHYLLYIFRTPRFDYAWHIRCCLVLSVATILLFVAWALSQIWLGQARRTSLAILASTFLLGWSSAAFDVFLDFPPLFWIVDAHALFHLVSIPVPLLWAKFICAEADAIQQKIKERIY
uniref:Post-GPI attachment to proteins factor 3 n=1 Tax=Globodera pallida TaxID=36090 RepID=A0A183C723_GLOPA